MVIDTSAQTQRYLEQRSSLAELPEEHLVAEGVTPQRIRDYL